ncbi:MAG: ATP-grasp domain-containing protein [Thermoleophilia bacterium]|nr:ATP-grasp domain-containing protein [Thermoleophilia bacterium]
MVEGGAAGARRRLLVLGAGAAQIGLLRAARERGLWVIAADRDPAAPGFVYADRRALISAEDEHGIARLAEAEHVDGLVAPGIDWPVLVAARVAARLGLRHPISPETALLVTSKVRQRERLEEAGVAQPRWRLTKEAHGLEFPCVVKPPDRQGQRGLSIVGDESELAPAVELAIAEARGSTALVEELVEGAELTVNGFSVGGRFHALTVTDRVVADAPAFGVALAHVWPARDGAESAARVAEEAVRALGITEGPSYTQVRLGSHGPRVIEVAARLGGGHDAELCAAVGVADLLDLAIDAALGLPVGERRLRGVPRAGGACVHFLVAREGQLRAVSGVDEAAASSGVVDVRVYRPPGHRFGPLRRGSDRAGAVLAVGGTRDEALARARAAAALIRFDVAPS